MKRSGPLARKTPLKRNGRIKPTRKPVKSMAARRHLAFVASCPCLICGAWPVQVHHLRHDPESGEPLGMAQRAPDAHTIPLCRNHHQDGGYGVAYHASPAAFQEAFGPEVDLWLIFEGWRKQPRAPYPKVTRRDW